MTEQNNLAIIEAFFEAYNSTDLKTLRSLLHQDIHWEHHNRFRGKGCEGLLKSIADWSVRAPGRHFGPILRTAGNSELTYVEHRWFAVIEQESEEFTWKAGDKIEFDAVSVLVVRDSLVVEWSDYG